MKSVTAAMALVALAASALAADPAPEWIWSKAEAGDNEIVYFRKTFELSKAFDEKMTARMRATCDNHMKVWINGKQVAQNDEWEQPVAVDVSKVIWPGKNVVVVEGRNSGGPAALIVQIEIKGTRVETMHVVSNATWKISDKKADGWHKSDFDDSTWQSAKSIAKYGDGPWQSVFAGQPGAGGKGSATPAESLSLLPGFKAELLYSVPRGEHGSWVNMCFDNKGRIIASNQNGMLYRVTIDKPTKGEVQVEPIEVRTRPNSQPIGKAHGLCYAFKSLYVMIADGGGEGNGLYRLRDTDGDDMYDKAELLTRIDGGGEHGPHAIRLSPDGKSLYVCAGNHTKLPKIHASRVVQRWAEDQLLPRMWDAGGHAVGILAPGGWICKIDPDAKHWELISIGFRNQFDIDFNAEGELFTYDSDMEWDIGLPWYRPTRINHCVSGSEFGWRSGSYVWPEYYPDNLPAVVNVGMGSPTGIAFGTGAKFPVRYQRALYALDWTYGIIYAVHMFPNGASYRGEIERFVSGKPLPVTDVAIGPDGAMYFTIGGRGTQSGLYRVSYVGKEPTDRVQRMNEPTPENLQRRLLDAFHSAQDSVAVDVAWPHLKSTDRFVRFSARTAIEHQPLAKWRNRAFKRTRANRLADCAVGFGSMWGKVGTWAAFRFAATP